MSNAIASEWTKFWSVRSTWWTLTASVVLMLAYAGVVALSVRFGSEPDLSAAGIVAGGAFYLAQFAVIALATLFITSEYASGGIRTSLQWVPVRNRLLLAKGAVLAPVLFVLGGALAGVGLAVSVPLMGGLGESTSTGGVVTSVLGMGAYFALLGLLCLGVGTALRSTAGAMTIVFVLLLVLPMIVASTGSELLVNYFPGFAGVNTMIESGRPNPIFGALSPYAPWVGALVCAAWSAGALLAGSAVLRRRDA